MTRFKFVSSLGILFCVFQKNIIAKNTNGHNNERKKENITEITVPQDYLFFSLEPDFDGKYTESYLSLEKNDYDKSYNGVTHKFSQTNTDALTSVNMPDNQASGFHSVHVDIDLEECGNHRYSYQVTGTEGSILISLEPTDNSQRYSAIITCTIELQVPPGMLAHVRVINTITVSQYKMIISDEKNTAIFDDYVDSLLSEFFTFSSIVKFQLMISINKSAFQLYMNFTAITDASRPYLKTTFLSSTAGILSE